MSDKLMPAPGYLLVKPVEVERETESGIVLPENVEKKPLKGEVLAVGPAKQVGDDKQEAWKELEEGSVIVYKKWAGNEYQPQGEDQELLFVKFEDVLAIVK